MPATYLLARLQNFKIHKSLPITKMIHAAVVVSGSESNTLISNNLLHSYFVCNSYNNALYLFGRMLNRDVVTWNTMMSGSVNSENFANGLCYFTEMVNSGIQPTQASYASVVTACAEMGCFNYVQQVHCFILKCGFSMDCCVGNSLLKGYAKLNECDHLLKISDEMYRIDDISVETMCKGYVENELLGDALNLVRYCRINGADMSPCALSNLVSLCSKLLCIDSGRQIHGYSIKFGFDSCVSVVNSLITFYSKMCNLEEAENLFDWFASENRDIITWNSLLNGYAYNREGYSGLRFIKRMMSSGIEMNGSTYSSFLSCCASVSDLKIAKETHNMIVKIRERFPRYSDNIVLTMYCRSDSLYNAVVAFAAMEARDVESYNLMTSFCRTSGKYEGCINTFFEARLDTIEIGEVMLSSVISSCSKLHYFELGEQIHGLVIRAGFMGSPTVSNSLLELLSQGGSSTDEMERFFIENCNKLDIFPWNMMLIGCSHHGLFDKSICILKEIKNMGVELNEFSYSVLLDSCSHTSQKCIGEQIHACVQKGGLMFDTALMNSLLTMYSNFGIIENACSVFEEISSPDSISWNALVSGYSQNGYAKESIESYKMMNENKVEANDMTFASIFMSCAMLPYSKIGSVFHAKVIKRALEMNLPVSNSLLTMYSKCGELSNSLKIFDKMVMKDLITWSSMLSALSHHGLGIEAMHIFGMMKASNTKPDDVTFITVLSACSHAGLVSEAWFHFKSMYEEYGITPNEKHYSCMVDILCRAGKLSEAKELVEGMPFSVSSLVWKTILSACRMNGNIELGKFAAKKIMDVDPQDSSPYVLLSELYASSGNRDGKAKVRKVMEDKGVKKEVGCSWVSS